MRYHYKKPTIYAPMYGKTVICNHPVYNRCTLYELNGLFLAVIQQRFDENDKFTYWTELDPWVANDIYLHPQFKEYFEKRAGTCTDGIYPTVTVRQIMWSLKMKPIKRERWETVFDRKYI